MVCDEPTVRPDPIEAVLAMVARTCEVQRDAVRLIGTNAATTRRVPPGVAEDLGPGEAERHVDEEPDGAMGLVVELIGPERPVGVGAATGHRLRVQKPVGDLTAVQRETLDELSEVLYLLLEPQRQPADPFVTRIEVAVAGPMRELEDAVEDLQRLSLSGRPARYGASIVTATARLRERTTARRVGGGGRQYGGSG